jgi:hypothetical protein
LGSFCAFGLRHACGRDRIGFVLHDPPLRRSGVPAQLLSIRNPQSPIRNRGAPGPQIGFVLHISPPASAPAGRNWVRSARFASGVPRPRVKLGSFCTFCLRHSPARGLFQSAIRNHQSAIEGPPAPKLGSFCTFHSPADPRPTRRPLPTYPSPPKFGFVLHNLLRRPPPAGPNWVRFTRMEFEVCSLKFEVRGASSSLNA